LLLFLQKKKILTPLPRSCLILRHRIDPCKRGDRQSCTPHPCKGLLLRISTNVKSLGRYLHLADRQFDAGERLVSRLLERVCLVGCPDLEPCEKLFAMGQQLGQSFVLRRHRRHRVRGRRQIGAGSLCRGRDFADRSPANRFAFGVARNVAL
jgi:hypothetical protein